MVWTTGCAGHLTAVTNPSERPLAIAVHPPLGLAPRNVLVAIRVDRGRDARAFCVQLLDGEFPVRRSCADTSEVRFREIEFYDVPSGSYVAALTVAYGDGHVESVTTTACYRGLLDEPCGGEGN